MELFDQLDFQQLAARRVGAYVEVCKQNYRQTVCKRAGQHLLLTTTFTSSGKR